MTDPAPGQPVAGYQLPSPQDLQYVQAVINTMQHILMLLGRDNRANTPEFDQFLGQYQQLQTRLFQHQQMVAESSLPVFTPPHREMRRHHDPKPLPTTRPADSPFSVLPVIARPAEEELGGLPPGQPLRLPYFSATMGPDNRAGRVSSGPEVRNLQKVLVHMGYEVEVSGYFDGPTGQAVKAFQLSHRLKVNGQVGVDMRKLLNELVTGEAELPPRRGRPK